MGFLAQAGSFLASHPELIGTMLNVGGQFASTLSDGIFSTSGKLLSKSS
nr:MAG TPA: hypothetical protein [Microviridae sp.]